MNCDGAFCIASGSGGCRSAEDPRGARHGRVSSRYKLHMRVVGVKRALHCLTNSCSRSLIGLRAALWFFSTQINCSPMWALWSCGRRTSVVQAQRQIHRVLAATYTAGGQRTRFRSRLPHYGDVSAVALRSVARAHLSTAALMPAEPHIRSPFPERLDTTIPHSQGHRARDGGSTLYNGISQPLFATVRPPGSNRD
jgi:hypothetical protein